MSWFAKDLKTCTNTESFSKQTKGKSLEQIDLLFSGPRVLLDLPEEELLRLQEEEIQAAIAEHRVELGEGKKMVHLENASHQ